MPNRIEDLFKLKDDLLNYRNIIVSYSILVVLKDIYRDPTVKFFYFDRITRSKILKSANSLFKFIVINNHIFREHIKCFSCVFVSYALY
jgi:hypothetical protein